ncbi:MAG: class II D-tagatose-bisphosphate aldolase, non-catalytic subunit [Clostridiales Family XIII bacterium]|jgi:D-tagatose-1,6-bisphosphate aldolase subunit GatZ/KbaZ|nr:class II D-tagatose-bisphosphate aldolase, non-catalytic subunit [Clostridiales Family XIII bacterium]
MKTNNTGTGGAIRSIIERRAVGEHCGVYAACTANPHVIRAAMDAGKESGVPVLIEATANQCNQYGGYSGMLPADFARYVGKIAEEACYDPARVVLGGDHLGPLVWSGEPAKSAMAKAEELVRLYADAGFGKIHLDTSMRLGDDDPSVPLSDDIVAGRAARLAAVCERAARRAGREIEYIVGSEVPTPGGAHSADDDAPTVTSPADFEKSWAAFRDAFAKAGLADAFSRVVGVVVQPGVEFGDDTVYLYDRAAAAGLMSKHREPEYASIVFEGHSTDYQPREKLREMVEDGVAILKVGPALTFSFREAVFALAHIENELAPRVPSRFREVLEEAMLERPADWEKYYTGTENERRLKRGYSFSDRSRYYFNEEKVRAARAALFANIDAADIPASLLSQYMPAAHKRLSSQGAKSPLKAEELARAHIRELIEDYLRAIK